MHDLIASLRHSGVQLWLEGDDIRVRAADSAQLSAVLETLRQRKPEIVAALREASNDIVRLPAAEAYELSHAQRRLWLLSQVDGASAAYNIPLAVRLEGQLDAGVLQRALAAVVARHESLRTAFVSRDGEPFHVVVDECRVDLSVQEVSPIEAQRQVRELAETPFDLSTAPLMRALLLRVDACVDPRPEAWELHLVFHHIVVDGWSLSVIMRELSALYDAFLHEQPSPLAPLRVHYRDYAAWQNERLRGDAAADDTRYWIEQLAPPLPQLNLPADFARPSLPTFRGALLTFTIDAARRAALHALAAGRGCTLFMLLAALVEVLLHRITGQEDILIATPVAAREHAELENQVGFYLNTLVLRDRVTSAMTFAELLARVRQTALDAYEHQHYPFDKLVEDLGVARDVTRSLTDVLVILQNAGTLDLSLAGVRATPLTSETGASKNDLTFDFVDGSDGLLIGIRYAADLFTRARIERMTGHFRELADAVLRDAEMPVGRLTLLPADEYAMVTNGFNDTAAPFDLSKSIVDLIDEQAARAPDRPAVSFEGSTMTYRQLTALSTAIAAHVHRAAGSGAVVGLFVERSLHTVAALLGIMRAGCAYVPLDPANPPRRLAHMLRDAAPALLLADNALAGRVIDLVAELDVAPRVLWLGDVIEQEPPIEVLPHIDPDSLAYILYTSGSTGVPKGVEIEHRGLANELLSMRERPGLDAADTLLAVATISFDIAGLDLYLPLICGAHVVVASSSLASDGLLLAERLRRGDITVLQATPGTWRMLLNAGWEGSPRLKILCGGEPLTRELATALATRCRSLWNLYGPTETTIWSTAFDVTAALAGLHASASIPVGGPIHNASVYIVDAELQPVPIGVPGEVCIGGAGVGRGYRNLPELTAKHYVANPFAAGRLYRTGDSGRFLDDGTLEIFGRLDQQVKVRGFRVETGEVESALLEHADVRDAVVVVRSDDRGEATLVAYVIASPFDGSALRDHLARRLPPYMIPSAFVSLDALPLAPTGKVDRAALPPPESFARTAGIPPRDGIETAIAAAWASVLQLPALFIDDNFFDAGGHSLKATRVLFRLQKELQVPLTLIDLFRNPTVAAFAALVRSRAGGPP